MVQDVVQRLVHGLWRSAAAAEAKFPREEALCKIDPIPTRTCLLKGDPTFACVAIFKVFCLPTADAGGKAGALVPHEYCIETAIGAIAFRGLDY